MTRQPVLTRTCASRSCGMALGAVAYAIGDLEFCSGQCRDWAYSRLLTAVDNFDAVPMTLRDRARSVKARARVGVAVNCAVWVLVGCAIYRTLGGFVFLGLGVSAAAIGWLLWWGTER